MKIKEDIIQHLRTVLAEYVAESGDSFGKYLFSKELGEIENGLYSKTRYTSFELDLSPYASENFSGEVEGELAVVEDATLIPLLEVV